MIPPDLLFFFDGKPTSLALYLTFEEKVLAMCPDAAVKVQKSQISFFNRHMFACASLLPVRKARDRPKEWLTVTFGLNRRVKSPRIDAASEPCSNRWTHHVLIASEDELDGELMGWIREAYEFAAAKKRRGRTAGPSAGFGSNCN